MKATSTLTTLILLLCVDALHSQGLPDPNSLRPPVVTRAPRADSRAQAARLVLFQVRQALTTGDTAVLETMVPDTIIPRAELSDALARNCQSLSRVVSRLDASFGSRAPSFRYLVVGDVTEVTSVAGDTTLVSVAHFLRAGSSTPVARFTFVQRDSAVLLASVEGVLSTPI